MGGRRPVIDDEEFIRIVESASDPPVVSTPEVADELGMSPEGALKRLDQLKDEGRIHGRVFGNVKLWWIPESE
jgi:DNA-binding Lrp family transcriptional regulator